MRNLRLLFGHIENSFALRRCRQELVYFISQGIEVNIAVGIVSAVGFVIAAAVGVVG